MTPKGQQPLHHWAMSAVWFLPDTTHWIEQTAEYLWNGVLIIDMYIKKEMCLHFWASIVFVDIKQMYKIVKNQLWIYSSLWGVLLRLESKKNETISEYYWNLMIRTFYCCPVVCCSNVSSVFFSWVFLTDAALRLQFS